MHQKFDIALKDIIKDVPGTFLKLLTGYETGKFIDVQFPDIQLREADIVIEAPDGEIIHIEIQSTNDAIMLERMYLYSAFIYNQHKRLPIQIVLYVGNKPLNMKHSMGAGLINYAYRLIDIRNFDGDPLIDSNDPNDNVLAILCKTKDTDATIRRVLAKFSLLSPREMENYIRKLLYLAGLGNLAYKVKQEVLNMPITIDLDEYEIFKDVFVKGELKGRMEGRLEGRMEGRMEGRLEGRLEGRQEGRLEGALKGIEGMLEIKYGPEGLELMEMVRGIDKIDRLDEFREHIKQSASVAQLRLYLQGNG
ncbi:hypothetical protein [Candidatus Magnetobacterium casense]|uniref:hypothetical protein n=1 Tax=Candidatus Magnetobacterium casense TaxID=1455061 RepID=UPI000A812FCD|nr:hypothetical protein [Candidatus Magnetobacterium casensis]